MEPEFVHVLGRGSIYVKALPDGKYSFELGDEVRIVKRKGKVKVLGNVDVVFQEALDFYYGGKTLDVAVIEGYDSVMFFAPSGLLLAYAEMRPGRYAVVFTDYGVRKFSYGDDVKNLGLKYRSGGRADYLSPVIEERDGYRRVCLTCVSGFNAAFVIYKELQDVDVITYYGFLSFKYGWRGSVVELPGIGRVDVSQLV